MHRSIRKHLLEMIGICRAVVPALLCCAGPASRPAVTALLQQWHDDRVFDAAFLAEARLALTQAPAPFEPRLVCVWPVHPLALAPTCDVHTLRTSLALPALPALTMPGRLAAGSGARCSATPARGECRVAVNSSLCCSGGAVLRD